VFNQWLIGSQGGTVLVQNPQTRFTGAQAVEFAAWLVAVSEVLPGGGKEAFDMVYRDVTAT
jgi:hypothetical protein